MKSKVTMNEIQKVSSKQIGKSKNIAFAKGDTEVKVSVKTALSLQERQKYEEAIVNMCFIEGKDGEVKYCPYVKKFAIEYNTVEFFTNIEMSDDVELIFDFLTSTKVIDTIVDVIGDEYYFELMNEVNQLIDYRLSTMIHESKLDDLLSSVVSLLKTIENDVAKGDGGSIFKYFEEAIPDFKEKIGQAFLEQKDNIKNE